MPPTPIPHPLLVAEQVVESVAAAVNLEHLVAQVRGPHPIAVTLRAMSPTDRDRALTTAAVLLDHLGWRRFEFDSPTQPREQPR